MTKVPEETLESARELLATMAVKLSNDPLLAELFDEQKESIRNKILQALDFAYQEGYVNGAEDQAAGEVPHDNPENPPLS